MCASCTWSACCLVWSMAPRRLVKGILSVFGGKIKMAGAI